MKLLIFIPHMGQGGVERSFINLSKELEQRNHTVKFITLNNIKTSYDEELNVIGLDSKRTLFSINKLSKIINIESPDVLISAQYYANVVAIISNQLSKNKAKVIISERNHLTSALKKYNFIKKLIIKFLIKFLYSKSDLIYGNSESVCKDLRKNFIKKSKVIKILNPFDPQAIIKMSNEKIDDKWITESNVPILIYIGRLEQQKDIATLIKSFELLNINHESKLLIIGDGSQKNKLSEAPSHLKSNIKHIDFDSNPYKYLKYCECMVLTSTYEGMPNVLIEAQILGIPIVATDSPGGTSEVLEYGKTGLLAEIGNPKDISEKIFIILNDKKIVSKLTNNFDESIKRFSPVKISNQLLEEIDNLN